MDLKEVDENGEVASENPVKRKVSQKDIQWDDPYPFYKGMIPQGDVEEEMAVIDDIVDKAVAMTTPSQVQIDDLRSGQSSKFKYCIFSLVLDRLIFIITDTVTFESFTLHASIHRSCLR